MVRAHKKYMMKCAAPILALSTLTGCKKDTYVEFSEIAETAAYDEANTQESDEQHDLPGADTAEIYEHFLDGKLTVEWREQQVRISDLFWENDIEYCFGDIDGDGAEELHIRDNLVYYVIKLQNKTPQILFEGWGGYEPVVTDKFCGIFYNWHKYGREEIKWIQINADGSEKSEETAYWRDHNKDGNMDEGDSFYRCEDIDMEQYVQYRQEQIAKQAENTLEWTGRRLKHFETWKEAYIDFIDKMHIAETVTDNWDYSLIYVDDDEIPELFIYTGSMAGGETIVSFYDGTIGTMNRERCGMQYIEYGGLLYNGNGNMGFYPCNVYSLEKGVFSEIGTGWISEHFDEQGNFDDYVYFWEDSAVTEAEFEASVDELIDRSKCVEPSVLYSENEILEILNA
ncbi:MAG: hypothetical protein K2N95_00200 [Lachnospiraceae bacterium]|nr:hypothetical protein [Lachnospiraceae bacterium]